MVTSLIALKLGVTSFIVVWIRVWVAMLVAPAMGQKLDKRNARILHQAHYDDLAGLPDRVLLRDEHNAVRVHSTIDLAHNLDRQIIAEGIEDPEARNALQQLGCDAAQGSLSASRPVIRKWKRCCVRRAISLLGNVNCS